jgi:hypothetical protein
MALATVAHLAAPQPIRQAGGQGPAKLDHLLTDQCLPEEVGKRLVAQFIGTFKEFPPSQRPQSFSIDQIMEKLQQPTND